MKIVLNIKELQLRGVLEELDKIGEGLDIVVNIKENGFKENGSKLEDGFEEESGSIVREELEGMQEEMRERVLGSIDA